MGLVFRIRPGSMSPTVEAVESKAAKDAMLAPMVNLAVRPRSPALHPFIKTLHYHEITFPFGLERILPSGGAHLMINLAEDQFRSYSGPNCERMHSNQGAVLAGPRGRATVLDTREFQWLIAVEFRMGGAAPFFRSPLDELSDQTVSLDDLWGIDGCLLREQLLEAPTPQDKLRVLEVALLAHFSGGSDSAIPHAAALLERGLPVAAAAARLGFLPRTFTRRFRDQVGLTPKRFARVRRMQRLIRSLRSAPSVDWCDLAAGYGFVDQAHLIHDFTDLTGITPTAYKPQSPQRGNHVPVAMPQH
jgi:AraC-like DNA-binding protein